MRGRSCHWGPASSEGRTGSGTTRTPKVLAPSSSTGRSGTVSSSSGWCVLVLDGEFIVRDGEFIVRDGEFIVQDGVF